MSEPYVIVGCDNCNAHEEVEAIFSLGQWGHNGKGTYITDGIEIDGWLIDIDADVFLCEACHAEPGNT